MTRGTTPTYQFELPIEAGILSEIFVNFKQGNVEIQKTGDQITVDRNYIEVTLSQAETLGFSVMSDVTMQIRAKSASGQAIASQIMREPVHDIIKEGEI